MTCECGNPSAPRGLARDAGSIGACERCLRMDGRASWFEVLQVLRSEQVATLAVLTDRIGPKSLRQVQRALAWLESTGRVRRVIGGEVMPRGCYSGVPKERVEFHFTEREVA